MASAFKAVKLALMALVSTLDPDIDSICPDLKTKPTQRLDPLPQGLMRELQAEVQTSDEGDGAELIFFGDSIFEAWRGTDMGWPSARAVEGPFLFKETFADKYRTLVLGVGGDSVAHLHWRLLNGNMPDIYHPHVAVVLIGINDLLVGRGCYSSSPEGIQALGNVTAMRILEAAELLLGHLPVTHLVLVSILPTGDWDNEDTAYQWPNALTPGIEAANERIAEAFIEEERVTTLNCNKHFVPFGWIESYLQADAIHPVRYGLKVLTDCISPIVDHHIARSKHHQQQQAEHLPHRAHLAKTGRL